MTPARAPARPELPGIFAACVVCGEPARLIIREQGPRAMCPGCVLGIERIEVGGRSPRDLPPGFWLGEKPARSLSLDLLYLAGLAVAVAACVVERCR